MNFKSYVNELSFILHKTEVTDKNKVNLGRTEGLKRWCTLVHAIKESHNTMYFVGNGASAMMASHMATDVCKNAKVRSMAFNDVSLMTAIGNDIAYEECFAFPLKHFADSGDILVAISSSGNSPNVIRAIETAYDIDLMVITLSAIKEDNLCRQMGDLNFYVPANTYGLAESAHQVILHCWFDMFETLYNDTNKGKL